jgi:RNA polymerase sigma factor (sigma-70 family)
LNVRIPDGPIRRRPSVFDPIGLAKPDPPIGLERWPNFLDKPPVTDGKPPFDRGRFVTSPTAHRPVQDENQFNLAKLLKETKGPPGGLLSATWEGGNRADPSPKVTTAAKGYEELVRAAEPTKEEFQKQFSKSYGSRWRNACLSRWDIRLHGKVRCLPDITYEQAANREYEYELCEYLDNGHPRLEKYLLCSLTLPRTWLEFRYLGWLLAAMLRFAFELERLDEDHPRSRGYHAIVGGKPKRGQPAFLSERELLSKDAIDRSKKNNARQKSKREARFLGPQEELELARRAKAGDIPAANRIILAHLPIAKVAAKKYNAKHDTDDLIQEGVFGIKKALDAFDPEAGIRFSVLAQRAVEWAIMDYLKKQRKQYAPSLDAPTSGTDTTFKDILVEPNPFGIEPEQPTLNCLNDRERYIIEARLNGTTRPVIGAELGISDERVRQLEARAIAKLKKFGHPRRRRQGE